MIPTTHGAPHPDPIGDIPAIDPALDARFRRLTARGNRAQRAGEPAQADECYRQAAAEAEALFARAMREGASAILIAPMAVTVAAHNLAASRIRAGEPARALAISEGAAERLIAAAASPTTPLALRLNCLRHLRHALNFLAELDHAPSGTGEVAASLAARTADVAAEVIRIAEILREGGTGSPSRPDRPRPKGGSGRTSRGLGPARRDL